MVPRTQPLGPDRVSIGFTPRSRSRSLASIPLEGLSRGLLPVAGLQRDVVEVSPFGEDLLDVGVDYVMETVVLSYLPVSIDSA